MEDRPRWLDEREARAWRGFVRLGVQVGSRLSRGLATHSGLSEADYAVLVQLSETEGGRLRAFELGETLQWEKSRLSHHLTRMGKRGLVVREQCESDARGSFVVLTAEGREVIEAAAPAHVEDVRRCLIDALDDEQLDALAGIAETVLDHLDRLEPEAGPDGDGHGDQRCADDDR